MTKTNEFTPIFSKTEFVLAFAALLIGFAGLYQNLQTINVNLGFGNFNLWELGLFSFSILCLSIYLFALDSIRYGIDFLEEFKIFKFLRFLAHIAYFFAIITPFIIFVLWFLVVILSLIPFKEINVNATYIYRALAIIGGFAPLALAIFQLWITQKTFKEEISERASEILIEADNVSKNKNWRLVVITSFRLLELMFKNKAEELGFDSRKIPFIRLVKIFVNKKLLSKEQAAKLDQTREIRNLALHSEMKISKAQADYVTDIVDEVSKNLTSPQFKSGYFEKIVLRKLNKLFLEHNISSQFNTGKGKRVDFMAEKSNFKYYIEVKMTDNPSFINKSIKQLQSILGNNDRGILVLPSSANYVQEKDSRIKILRFDIENENFINKSDIYKWI